MLKDYYGLPEYIEGIGNVYPILIKDYEDFRILAEKFLIHNKDEFKIENEKITLFEIIVYSMINFEIEQNEINNKIDYSIKSFIELLKLALRCKEIYFDENNLSFKIDNEVTKNNEINKENFDIFRKIVMRQNLLYEPLVAADIVTQHYLNEYRKQKMLDTSSHSSLEGILQILCLVKGRNIKELLNEYTYYQVMGEFSRYQEMLSYEWIKSVMTSGLSDKQIKVNNIAREIDMYSNPETEGFLKSQNEDIDNKLAGK